MHRLLTFVVCTIAIVSVSLAEVEDDGDVPVIKTATASIRGKRVDLNPYLLPDYHASLAAYTRIPYAQPPVGDRRFRRPEPAVIEGDFDATRVPIACSQAKNPGIDINLEISEDCLYLDVYVPESQLPDNAAVMVWIHGGGFALGAASIPKMLPLPLAAMNDVIIVGINYRLNVFGFLGTGDEEMPFNLGMLDQVQALKWVQENIAAFGGDPNRVTIFGESAGGVSVSLQVHSPMSAGLFSRAIMQSGVAKMNYGWQTAEKGAELATRFGQVMNCSDADDDNGDVTVQVLVECLRALSAEDIINFFQENPMAGYEFPLGPTVDGEFLPRSPVEMSADGETNDVAIMVGCLDKEGSMFLFDLLNPAETGEKPKMNKTSAQPMITMFAEGLDDLGFDVLSLIYMSPEELTKPDPDYVDVVIDFDGDSFFLCSTFSTANDLAKAGKTVYTYLMTHVPSKSMWGKDLTWTGATHGEDIPYVFGTPLLMDQPDPEGESTIIGHFTEEEIGISRQIMAYWSNFAKTGDPNLSSKDDVTDSTYPAWPQFTEETGTYKDLSKTFPNHNGHPQPKRCYFLDEILPKMTEATAETSRLKSLLEEKVNADSGKTCEDPESCPDE